MAGKKSRLFFPKINLSSSKNAPRDTFLSLKMESIVESIVNALVIEPMTQGIIQTTQRNAKALLGHSPKIANVMGRTRFKSNSVEWLNVRGRLLTASDMAGVLGQNKYSSPNGVFLKKTHQCLPFTGNAATRWGQKYEQEAADVYEILTGMKLVEEDIGLIIHDYEKSEDLGRKRYAATPDRIAVNGVLLEIKCPFSRKIGHSIPPYYLAQIQCQLEVTGCDLLHFVQYKPPSPIGKGRFDIVQVKRDPLWWKMHLPVFDAFWDRVIAFYEKRGLELGETHLETPKESSPKPLKMKVGDEFAIV